ncbi:hypothetical protein [Sedimentitalea nanhaiensis]|uniref:Uncharacterized protein n=1 Tax=Sedimentitalea nanhaiensis TaxID=999627 RepID=A0A1I6X9R0_9RHOB|nr:hypothetical protein [Sedimentitalea nanhaiensis]SFT35005.1 hypothetical protein SAMN05216236_101160 [Sedimentitalea nanhaiensis]
MRRAWFALVGFAVLATASSGLMQVWTIPIITANTGDFQMFDLRRQGYDLGQAVTCLARMGPDGVSTYLGAQRVLDTLFPVGLTGVLTLGIYLGLRRKAGRAAIVGALLPLGYFYVDLLENAAVARLLKAPEVTAQSVEAASAYTVLKFQLFDASVLLLLLCIIGHVVARSLAWFRRRS